MAAVANRAILLLSCPDARGIVAEVTRFISDNGGNILDSSQHNDTESGTFFMRIEWDISSFSVPPDRIGSAFSPLAERFSMTIRLSIEPRVPKVAIFVSRQLHCLYDLILRIREGEIEAEICAVISNHRDAAEVCETFGLPFYHVPVMPPSGERDRGSPGGDDGVTVRKREAERRQQEILLETGAELVVLARYMQILSDTFVGLWTGNIINIHHSFLPAFVGARPYHQAFERGVKIIGATSHYVTPELDQGPIIEQDIARVSHRDQVSDLVRKGRNLERMVLQHAVKLHLEHRVLVCGNKTVVFE